MAVARPHPIYSSGCTNNVTVTKYRPPRIAVADDAIAIVVDVDRAMGAKFSQYQGEGLTLKVWKFLPDPNSTDISDPYIKHEFTLALSEYADYQAFFKLNAHVFEARGIWNAQLMRGDSCLGLFELAVAPSMYVAGASVQTSECADSGWTEPPNPDFCTVDNECACDAPCDYEPCQSCNTPTPCEMPRRQGYGV